MIEVGSIHRTARDVLQWSQAAVDTYTVSTHNY
jgi:hypothetical protein